MGLYREWIFPRLMQVALGSQAIAELRAELLREVRGRVLEIGFGTGLNLPHYPQGTRITGLDLSAEMLDIARSRAGDLGRDVDLREGDAHDLPFADESFDTVVCTYALCSIPDDALIELLRETYCRHVGVELGHIHDSEVRGWLQNRMEWTRNRIAFTRTEQLHLLAKITEAEVLEQFLQMKFLGSKRFSLEGAESLIPMLDRAIERASRAGVTQIVIGMAHRGRLNVLVHNVGRPYVTIFAEFEGGKKVAGEEEPSEEDGTGDVKYHLGAEGAYLTRSGKAISVALAHNPSHLEFVGPVVDGNARARQTQRRGREAHHDPSCAVPVVIHGDAAFAGQGVVAETLNLNALRGYGVGGTVHLITNNQVGFTTDMTDARSTTYASDLAKGFDVPVIHVNADDAERVIFALVAKPGDPPGLEAPSGLVARVMTRRCRNLVSSPPSTPIGRCRYFPQCDRYLL